MFALEHAKSVDNLTNLKNSYSNSHLRKALYMRTLWKSFLPSMFLENSASYSHSKKNIYMNTVKKLSWIIVVIEGSSKSHGIKSLTYTNTVKTFADESHYIKHLCTHTEEKF